MSILLYVALAALAIPLTYRMTIQKDDLRRKARHAAEWRRRYFTLVDQIEVLERQRTDWNRDEILSSAARLYIEIQQLEFLGGSRALLLHKRLLSILVAEFSPDDASVMRPPH